MTPLESTSVLDFCSDLSISFRLDWYFEPGNIKFISFDLRLWLLWIEGGCWFDIRDREKRVLLLIVFENHAVRCARSVCSPKSPKGLTSQNNLKNMPGYTGCSWVIHAFWDGGLFSDCVWGHGGYLSPLNGYWGMSDCRRRSCWGHRCRPMSPCSGHSVHPWWSAGARWSAARKLRQKHASTSSLSNPFKNLDWFYIEFIDASLFLFSALNGSLSYLIVYFLMCWCHLKQKPCRRCGWWLTCRQFRRALTTVTARMQRTRTMALEIRFYWWITEFEHSDTDWMLQLN